MRPLLTLAREIRFAAHGSLFDASFRRLCRLLVGIPFLFECLL
jgi:hypothetical protein